MAEKQTELEAAEIEQALQALVDKCLLKRIIFSKPVEKTIRRGEARLITLKRDVALQFTKYTWDGKVFHENIPAGEAGSYLLRCIQQEYRQINLFTEGGECQFLISSKGKMKIIGKLEQLAGQTEGSAVESHNRTKRRFLPENQPVDFLVYLGISDQNGRIYDKKYDKYRQINRFLEFLNDFAPYFPKNRPIKVVDFGCGKSYLTFAVHYYFTKILGLETDIIGLDLKADVISLCRRIAEDLQLKGIQFQVGDIHQFAPVGDVDLTISLHACDIATDAALAQAIQSNSKFILSVPCCHHELVKQMECPPLEILCQHGLLKQRLAELATDGLRAKYLEAEGYRVQVLEFIESEHTPKNLMIRAMKTGEANEKALNQYLETKKFFHAEPSLERILREKRGNRERKEPLEDQNGD